MEAHEFITRVLSDPEALRLSWAELDRLVEPDDVMWIEYGRPEVERLNAVAREYEETCAAPFPHALRSVWEVYDGLAVSSDFEPRLEAVSSRDLNEPALWPAATYGDHYVHIDSDRLGDGVPFAFASVPDQGVFVLSVFPDDANPPVYWVDDSPHHKPRFVADDFAAFVQQWCECALNVATLLKRVGAPGWG